MEVQELPFDDQEKTTPLNSTVDTSRPFRSVKEAVAIFGERFLAQEIYTPKPFFTIPKHETITQKSFSPLFSSPPSASSLSPINGHDQFTMKDSLKKLEAELKETKRELELLKERESDTEIALASLNAELHKNMSKMAEAEAKSAGEKALMVATRSTSTDQNHQVIKGKSEEEAVETMYLKSLAEVLRLGDKEGYFGENKTKMKKKKKKNMEKEKEIKKKKLKPIIPLVGDLLSWKKTSSSSSTKNNTLFYTSDHMY